MFGLLRTILALMVMSAHLLELPYFGANAVFGFYIISGYLMTLIMHEGYGYSGRGRLNFSINRVLRLYPQYWFASLFSIFLLLWIGTATVNNYHAAIYIPTETKDIFSNIFLMFASWNPVAITPRLVPPAWALTVEIFFYVLICFGISKNIKRVKIWIILSLCYLLATYLHPAGSWYLRYYPIPAASLPFSIGSLIYFLKIKARFNNSDLISQKLNSRNFMVRILPPPPSILLILFFINSVVFSAYNSFFEIGQCLNLLIMGQLVYSLASGERFSFISKEFDTFIGDFSYPIYLLHWQTGLLVSYIVFSVPINGHSFYGVLNYVLSLIAIFLISYAVIRFIDKPVQNIRTRVKTNTAVP